MKETIEWYRVTDAKRPDDGEEILMQLHSDDGTLCVYTGFYTDQGFVLAHGEYVSPTMWCYFPKGEQ